MKPKSLMAIVAALAMIMLLATTTVADHTVPLGASGTDQSGECTGDYFKIEDAGALVEGTHTYTGTTKEGNTFSVTLTVVFDGDDEVDSITVVAIDPGYDLIVVKAGTEFFMTDGTSITPGNGKAISNIAFCLTEETTTTSSTDTETTSSETTSTDTETTSSETTSTDTETTSSETTSTDTETTSSETTSTDTETTSYGDRRLTDTETTCRRRRPRTPRRPRRRRCPTRTTDDATDDRDDDHGHRDDRDDSTDTETTETTATDTETTETTATDTETTETTAHGRPNDAAPRRRPRTPRPRRKVRSRS